MQGVRSRITLVAALLLFGSILAGCERGPVVRIHTMQGEAVDVPVELALSAEAHMRGLMYRKNLAAEAGMLFVFPESSDHAFWMKNTPLSLDMIFVDTDLQIVGIVENATPFSLKTLSVGKPSRYVLEVNAGFSQRHRLRPGDRIEFVRVPAAVS